MADYLDDVKSRGLDDFEMQEVRLGLQHGLTTTQVDIYAQSKYNSLQMKEIRLGLEHGLTDEQMNVFLNPEIEYDVMQHNRIKIEQGNVIDESKKTDLRKKKIINIRNLLFILILVTIGSTMIHYLKSYYDKLYQNLFIEFPDNIQIEYGQFFLPASYIESYTVGDDIEIIMPDSVRLDRLGKNTFVYQIKNSVKSVTQELTVTCVDTKAPEITLNKYSTTLTRGDDKFIPEEYIVSANDNVDGDLTDSIICSFKNNEKNQMVVYSVSDSSGNKTEVEFGLKWKDPPEPEIVYVEKPVYIPSSGGTSSSGTSSGTSNSGNTGSGTASGNTVQPQVIAHGTQSFMFSDGYDLDTGYSACVVALNSIGYGSCTAITGADGLYIGYQLNY